jgi:acyl-CoA synthetase (AMP-forming)/AMP-acid ligase II
VHHIASQRDHVDRGHSDLLLGVVVCRRPEDRARLARRREVAGATPAHWRPTSPRRHRLRRSAGHLARHQHRRGGVHIERRAKLPGQEHVPAGAAVNQAAVVGTPHPRWGEAGVAFVVLAPGAEAAPEELRGWCRERLAAYKVPVRVLVVEELPRNATGKVLKAPLRDSARGGD